MKVTIVDHPIIRTRLSRVRAVETDTESFRRHLHDIARLMCFEVCRDLEVVEAPVQTPITETTGYQLARPVVLVPILRAGVGMLQGFVEILSEASIGNIGMYRDEETLEPKSYYSKMPQNLGDADVILIDPMLATGSSSAEAAAQLKMEGAANIRFVCLIASPEGVKVFNEAHPDITIYAASVDEKLDENAYIVPGLGDAGDRYFGT
ncbi:MAG: uracil phosphoribosyltransferase [Verrucomicrobiales bacterium]|nr:uracil phosphoribosyltransferase [Verrucomicrobiales bacterium]